MPEEQFDELRRSSVRHRLPGREEVNGQSGALFFDREGRLINVAILDVTEGQIQSVSTIVNPDKLEHLGPVADLRALPTTPPRTIQAAN